MTHITLYQGHTLNLLRALAAESVHCAITSQPYWGLRDYGLEPQVWGGETECRHEWGEEIKKDKRGLALGKEISPDARGSMNGQFCRLCGAWRGSFGLEPALDCLGWAAGNPCGQCYICHSLQIYREVRRVLRADGTFWLNIGDSYNGSGGAGGDYNPGGLKAGQPRYPGRNAPGLKPKDLCGVPWRLALALQADGWWLRQKITWWKPNCMPESAPDRPTGDAEDLYLFSKSAHYFWDEEAVRIINRQLNTKQLNLFPEIDRNPPDSGRKLRSVWCLPTESFTGQYCRICQTYYPHGWKGLKKRLDAAGQKKEGICRRCGSWEHWLSHFATFPQRLVEPMIKAGTSEKGVCPHCGAPWQRVVEKKKIFESGSGKSGNPISGKHGPNLQGGGNTGDIRKGPCLQTITTGWTPTCACPHTEADLVPATALDPFSGMGTALLVAAKLQRRAIGCELNSDYLEMSRQRLARDLGMLAEIEVKTIPLLKTEN